MSNTRQPAIITLTTDFGHADWFVGTMKGVIVAINPRASVIDITHEIPRGDICAGAFALRASHRFFPKGTIHVAVVDPGVGSAREAIAVQTADYVFVAPDNGLLSWALKDQSVVAARRLENRRLFRMPVSQTFHGRDVFAPVAAHLSAGEPFRALGPAVEGLQEIAWPEPVRTPRGWRGQVIYIDRFGNAITNLAASLVTRSTAATLGIGRRSIPLGQYYQSVPPGKPVAVSSSSDLIEIAVNGGSAAKQLRLAVNTPVELRTS